MIVFSIRLIFLLLFSFEFNLLARRKNNNNKQYALIIKKAIEIETIYEYD